MKNIQNTITKLKVKKKPKYTTSENIIFYTLSFASCFLLLYTLCYALHLIDTITF